MRIGFITGIPVVAWLLSASTVLATDFNVTINPPNPSLTSVEAFIVAILDFVTVVAIPIIVLAIIYAGFLYVTARGNAQQTEQATRALTYAIIGAVLVLGAVALSEVIKNLISSL
jgi:hypothetical protein